MLLALVFLISNQVSAQENIPNIAFEYSLGINFASFNPKFEKQTMNWNPSFKRFLGSKQERGGGFYLGTEYNSKLRFKYNDSTGVKIINTSTADAGFGFAIQSNLSSQYCGPVVTFTAGFPLENRKELKFHFSSSTRFNFNIKDFPSPLDNESNVIAIFVEVGVHGLYNEISGVRPVLLSLYYGAGIVIKVPDKN